MQLQPVAPQRLRNCCSFAQGLRNCCSVSPITSFLLYGFDTAVRHDVLPHLEMPRCSFSPLRQGLRNCCSFSHKTSFFYIFHVRFRNSRSERFALPCKLFLPCDPSQQLPPKGCETVAASTPKSSFLLGFETAVRHVFPHLETLRCSFNPVRQGSQKGLYMAWQV